MEKPSRVLIIGPTGYIGKHIAQASLDLGYPTFLLIRPDVASDINKVQLLLSLKRSGARVLEGSVHDHSSLVAALQQVDIVISTMAEERLLDQLKLIQAIQEVGSIKRFLPSEFGMDPDRMVHCAPPAGDIFVVKRKVRRAIEAAGIPYTYVSANCFAGYFLAGLAQIGHFMPPTNEVVIYGDGSQKVIWMAEEDVATYAIKTIEDPRAVNKTVYLRPPRNILSQNEVVVTWEKISGKVLEKKPISEVQWIKKMTESSHSETLVVMGHFLHIFFKGDLYNFEIGPDGREASQLYPEVKYTTVESYLQRFV